MKNLFYTLLLSVTLLTPALTWGASQPEPAVYVIKQGDTLWGLSERFIKDPFYWPKMWEKNSQLITNPHLIYPGGKILVFPDHFEVTPQTVADVKPNAAKAPEELKLEEVSEKPAAEVSYNVIGSEGFLVDDDFSPAGFIIGIQGSRVIAGDDDIVYTDIGKEFGAKGGDKFSIYRKSGVIRHPATNQTVGTKVIPLGTLQITELEQKTSRAIVNKAFQEITPGTYLLPYQNNRQHEVSLKIAAKELQGYIVESYNGANIVAAGDIVYLDLGSNQGAETGNMLYIVRDVSIDSRYSEGTTERLPQELLGAVVILESGKNSSTAVVVKSIDAIYRGDKIISISK